MRTIASYGSKRSPAKRPSAGCVNTTNRRSPNWAITASRRCAPRRWRCTKPTPKSRLSGVPASTCTTSGAMRCTQGASGAARLLRSTRKTRQSGMSSSTWTLSLPKRTRTGCGAVLTSSNPSAPVRSSVSRVAAATPVLCANSTSRRANSSPTDSTYPRPRPISAGRTKTRCWWAPTSAKAR